MQITKQSLSQFRADLKEAVAELERKYGVTIEPGKISYTDESFDIKVTVTNEGGKERQYNEYIKLHLAYGQEIYKELEGKFGSFVTINNRTYEIIGIDPKSKYDILVKDLTTEKVFGFTVTAVARAITGGQN